MGGKELTDEKDYLLKPKLQSEFCFSSLIAAQQPALPRSPPNKPASEKNFSLCPVRKEAEEETEQARGGEKGAASTSPSTYLYLRKRDTGRRNTHGEEGKSS